MAAETETLDVCVKLMVSEARDFPNTIFLACGRALEPAEGRAVLAALDDLGGSFDFGIDAAVLVDPEGRLWYTPYDWPARTAAGEDDSELPARGRRFVGRTTERHLELMSEGLSYTLRDPANAFTNTRIRRGFVHEILASYLALLEVMQVPARLQVWAGDDETARARVSVFTQRAVSAFHTEDMELIQWYNHLRDRLHGVILRTTDKACG